MKRRNFVKAVALSSIGAPLVLKNFSFGAVSKQLFKTSKNAEDRVFVIIRLNGGNDGLNTLIPLDQYDNLAIQRPNIILNESSLLNITPTLGLHPAMTGMQGVFNDGKMTVVQNVGYPEQNRSHFRSMDIWTSGLMDPTATTGWLGRHFTQSQPNYPTGYPNATYPDPFAITMGYDISSTCQGLMANFSFTVNDPADVFNLYESSINNDGTYYGSQMDYLSTVIAQTNDFGVRVNAAAAAGSSLSTLYDANNELAMQLQNVAKMIKGGLETKIYILNIGGFDTHDSQVDAANTSIGQHAELLKGVSDAIGACQNDLQLLGIENRVAGMTFSEFGRQIASNASTGTDHGDASCLFLFGSCISSGVIGNNPVISNTVENQAGLPMQIDFRDIYASILKDWFEATVTDIQSMFEHTVTFYPVLGACNLSIDELSTSEEQVLIYPNPCAESAKLRIHTLNETVTIQIRTISGELVMEVLSKNLTEGTHDLELDLNDVASGMYQVNIFKASGNFNKRFMKLKHV